MRIIAALFFCILASAPASAADPIDIFGTILGEIEREVTRQQRKEQRRKVGPQWEACAGGDTRSCNQALRVPGLSARDRKELERMSDAAFAHRAFEHQVMDCEAMRIESCDAALRYPLISKADRVHIGELRRRAVQHERASAAFRRDQQQCENGSIIACNRALANAAQDPAAVSAIQRQRQGLLEKQRAEQVLLRARRLAAERAREAERRKQQAEIRAYESLRTDCAAGNRAACRSAINHRRAQQGHLAKLREQERALAPMTEQISNLFARAGGDTPDTNASSVSVGVALVGAVGMLAAVLGLAVFIRGRTAGFEERSEPPSFSAEAGDEANSDAPSALSFPLTGHMPTDVRRALQFVRS